MKIKIDCWFRQHTPTRVEFIRYKAIREVWIHFFGAVFQIKY